MENRSRTALEEELAELLGPVVESEGLELVELVLRGGGGIRTLRLDVDRAGARGVGLEDCQRLSRAVEAKLEETDPIPSKYVLEVSSPGVGRPIRSRDDIRRNTGRRVVVTTAEPVEGSCSHTGLLLGSDGGDLLLQEEGEHRVRIPLAGVVRAFQELEL